MLLCSTFVPLYLLQLQTIYCAVVHERVKTVTTCIHHTDPSKYLSMHFSDYKAFSSSAIARCGGSCMESPGDFMCEYLHVPSTVAIAGGRGNLGGGTS